MTQGTRWLIAATLAVCGMPVLALLVVLVIAGKIVEEALKKGFLSSRGRGD